MRLCTLGRDFASIEEIQERSSMLASLPRREVDRKRSIGAGIVQVRELTYLTRKDSNDAECSA